MLSNQVEATVEGEYIVNMISSDAGKVYVFFYNERDLFLLLASSTGTQTLVGPLVLRLSENYATTRV